jgi:chemotaxis protein CheD
VSTRHAPPPVPQPQALPGFAHISRYWDPTNDSWAAKIQPGEYYVTRSDELVVTVLGSCVSACMRDPVTGIGGMNHFMLPENSSDSSDAWGAEAARYGVFAMEQLINEILRAGGCKERLEVKITGGGKVLPTCADIGQQNITFAHEFLAQEKLPLAAEEVGGPYPRRVYYEPQSGRVRVKKLIDVTNDTIQRRETEHLQRLRQRPLRGEVELFDE